VAIGVHWLYSNTNGHNLVAVGDSSLYNAGSGENNTAIGSKSLYSNTTGSSNTSIGYLAAYFNGSGYQNTALGIQSLYSNGFGTNNTAIGSFALVSNIVDNNTAVGYSALAANTTGSSNVAVGESLIQNTSGNNNTAVGRTALNLNITGSDNVAVGFGSAPRTTGGGNTAVGSGSLENNISGARNTAIGYFAGNNIPNNLYNFTAIGYNSGHSYSNSNTVEIGNDAVTWIGGQVGWSTYSDRRIKENIKENVPGLVFINKLRPVTYNLNIHKQNEISHAGQKEEVDWPGKYDMEKKYMTGFIAQEVETAALQSGYDFHGITIPKDPNGLYSLSYSEFVVPLVKAVQELDKQNQELKKKVDDQQYQYNLLLKRIEKLERKN